MNQRSYPKRVLILFVILVAAIANVAEPTHAAEPDFPVELTAKAQEPSKQLTPKQVYQRMLKSTVWVQQHTGNGMVMNGTGWIVDKSKGLIMTNHHVVKFGDKVQMFMPKFDGNGRLVTNAEDYQRFTRPIKGVVVDSDKTRDLAIIKVEGSLPKASLEFKRAKQSASPADMVHIVGGKPMGSNGAFVYANGYIREVSKGKGIFGGRDIWLIRNTVPTNKGNSGGALINNQGEVIGVANMAFFTDQIQAVAGGVDLREVNDYFKEVTTLYPPSSAKENYLVGRRHYFAGRYDSANRYFSAAIRIDPKHANAYRMRGFCFDKRNELDQAKREFTAAIEIDSGNWNAFYGRGRVQRKQGNVEAAIRDHSEAIPRPSSHMLNEETCGIKNGSLKMPSRTTPARSNWIPSSTWP